MSSAAPRMGNPRPTSPSTASSPRATRSKWMVARLSRFSVRIGSSPISTPSARGSTRKTVTPRWRSAGSTVAATSSRPACAACEMKTFEPLSDQPVAVRSARVCTAARSLPPPRLGQGGRGQHRPVADAGQPAIALRVGPEADNRPGDQRVGHRDHRRDDPVDAGQLLADDAVGHDVGAAPAVGLRQQRSQIAEGNELVDELGRVPLGPLVLLDARQDLALGELAHGGPHLALLRREVEIGGAARRRRGCGGRH